MTTFRSCFLPFAFLWGIVSLISTLALCTSGLLAWELPGNFPVSISPSSSGLRDVCLWHWAFYVVTHVTSCCQVCVTSTCTGWGISLVHLFETVSLCNLGKPQNLPQAPECLVIGVSHLSKFAFFTAFFFPVLFPSLLLLYFLALLEIWKKTI